ncbi:MAG: glycosyltransferase family 4 protein [Minisyncoccia bacterium]
MPKILSLKSITGDPADGISNFMKAVFTPMKSGDLTVYAKHFGAVPSGALENCSDSLLEFLIKRKPEILLGVGHPKEIFYLLIKPKNTKYVIIFHSMLLKQSEGHWKVRTPWWLRRLIFQYASLVISPSVFSANSVKSLMPNISVKSVLNGVDLDIFLPSRKDRGKLFEKYGITNDDVPLVSFVGSMHYRKRPDLVSRIASSLPKARFIMVGREIGEFDIKKATSRNKNIIWVPQMPREDIANLFSSSLAFIFPSLNDASPAVVLEAMACGCIPIVSESGGSPEFFENGTSGFSVPVGEKEEEEFILHIKRILKDESFRKIVLRNARKEAEKHSWDKVSKEYLEIFNE